MLARARRIVEYIKKTFTPKFQLPANARKDVSGQKPALVP